MNKSEIAERAARECVKVIANALIKIGYNREKVECAEMESAHKEFIPIVERAIAESREENLKLKEEPNVSLVKRQVADIAGYFALVENWRNPMMAAESQAPQPDEAGFDEATETRWQNAIYEICKKAVGPQNDHLIDGGGCDSGDALDFTLTEIRQAFAFLEEKVSELGDGEPSPSPAKGTVPSTIDGIAEWREKYYLTHRIHDAVIDEELFECLMLQAYASQFTGANFLELRSGAAQEVSPRARAMKIAKEIDQECIEQDDSGHRFEVSRAAAIIEKLLAGDTRELKAALQDSTLRLEQLICYTDLHHETAQIYREIIADNKRLLGL